MTAAYIDVYTIGQDTPLRERIGASLMKEADYLIAGGLLLGVTPSAISMALARSIAENGPGAVIPQFAEQVAQNGTAQTAAITVPGSGDTPGTINTGLITDATIDSVVGTDWSYVAGG